MRSILMGDPQAVAKVYTSETMQILVKEADLKTDEILTAEHIGKGISGLCDIKYIFSTWGMPRLSEQHLQRMPKLECVFYAAGSVQGFARPLLQHGVRVFSAWVANGIPVAEFTLAQILLANKNYFTCSRLYSSGDIDGAKQAALQIRGNYGNKVGIIGAGMIGKLVIGMLKRHDLEVLLYDPFVSEEKAAELGVRKTTLEDIFSECAVVSNHLADNEKTRGMLKYDLFKQMQKDAVFINTGRGAQVIEDDLCRVLQERSDLTALLDVTWPEPPKKEHLFYTLPNVVLSPHIAGSVGREVERMAKYVVEDYLRYKEGTPCKYEVTEAMLATMA